MTALPTPEEAARADTCDGHTAGHEPAKHWFVACETCLAAAIRADRLRVLGVVATILAVASDGADLAGRLGDLRREIEGGS